MIFPTLFWQFYNFRFYIQNLSSFYRFLQWGGGLILFTAYGYPVFQVLPLNTVQRNFLIQAFKEIQELPGF